MLRSVSNYSTKNAVLDGELFYEANTERRALLQETYVEVGPEIGQYVWDDLNGDGTQQVDEFFWKSAQMKVRLFGNSCLQMSFFPSLILIHAFSILLNHLPVPMKING